MTAKPPKTHMRVARYRIFATVLFAVAIFSLSASSSSQQEPGSAVAAYTNSRVVSKVVESSLFSGLPDIIVIREPDLYPEDVEWDGARNRFLVSSVTRGSVATVHDNGVHQSFISGAEITSSIGIHIDKARDRLLVAAADFAAVSDPKVKGEAKLAVYDLASGERKHLVDLARLRPQSRHLANDVTTGPDGTAYVTDSLAPVIYQVTTDGEASVLVEDDRLAVQQELGLNGIEYHPDGYLLVAMSKTLYRVPLDAPEELTEVQLSQPTYVDGLELQPNGNLVVAAPFAPAVLELSSDDSWRSARIVGRVATPGKVFVTNTTRRTGAIYAINTHFAEIGGDQLVKTFEIFRVELPSVGPE